MLVGSLLHLRASVSICGYIYLLISRF